MAESKSRRRRVRSREATDATLADLAARFPEVFCEPRVPLAVGIYYQIRGAAPEFTAARLSAALHRYTRKRSYLAALVPGAPRIAIGGYADGYVTETEAVDAARKQRAIERAMAKAERRLNPEITDAAA